MTREQIMKASVHMHAEKKKYVHDVWLNRQADIGSNKRIKAMWFFKRGLCMNNIFACLNSLVGREIVKKDKDEDVAGRWKCKTKTTKWLVTKAYPNYVMAERTCENGYIYRECFNIGTLICEGIIRQKGGELND